MLSSWATCCNSLSKVPGGTMQCQKPIAFLQSLQWQALSLLTASTESTSSRKEWFCLRGMKSSFVQGKNRSLTGIPVRSMGMQCSECNRVLPTKLFRSIWWGQFLKFSSSVTYWQVVPSREGIWKVCRENTLQNKNRESQKNASMDYLYALMHG